MVEIALLQKHIIEFSKTKQDYDNYKKTGYNRDFKEQHITEILLHQAAKNYFKELGLPKLPKMQELKNEYAILIAEKKKTYGKYSSLRSESQEILNAKQNVECILDIDKTMLLRNSLHGPVFSHISQINSYHL